MNIKKIILLLLTLTLVTLIAVQEDSHPLLQNICWWWPHLFNNWVLLVPLPIILAQIVKRRHGNNWGMYIFTYFTYIGKIFFFVFILLKIMMKPIHRSYDWAVLDIIIVVSMAIIETLLLIIL